MPLFFSRSSTHRFCGRGKYCGLPIQIKIGLCYLLVLVLAFPEIILGGLSLHPGLLHPFGITNNVPETLALRKHVPSFHVEMSTAAYYEAPINEFIGRSLRNGFFPLWLPNQSGGGPLLAQYRSKLFFPYQLLENFAGPTWYDFLLLARLYLAGLGTFLLFWGVLYICCLGALPGFLDWNK